MDKRDSSNKIQFFPQFDNFSFYNNELIPKSLQKNYFLNNYGIIPKISLLEPPKNEKIKFITIKKRNKTSFIVSKKKPREKTNKNSLVSNGRWTKEERIKFAYALYHFGTNWKKIRDYISTRSIIQLRSHAQKYLIKLKKCPYLIQKGFNFTNLNWENSLELIRNNLNDEEILSVFISIESELEDNKRMTNRYRERKELLLKKKIFLSFQHNSCLANSDENNTSNTENICEENEIDIFNDNIKFNNLININDDNDSYIFNYNKVENPYYARNEKENIFYNKYINNLNMFHFFKENYFDNFDKEEKSEFNDF